jgi:hypothetical protein
MNLGDIEITKVDVALHDSEGTVTAAARLTVNGIPFTATSTTTFTMPDTVERLEVVKPEVTMAVARALDSVELAVKGFVACCGES